MIMGKTLLTQNQGSIMAIIRFSSFISSSMVVLSSLSSILTDKRLLTNLINQSINVCATFCIIANHVFAVLSYCVYVW